MTQDKLKICYISNSAAPSTNASSLQTAKLCESLSRIGHNVKLILPDTGFKKNYFKFYKIKNRFKIKRIKYFDTFPMGFNYYLYSIVSLFFSNIKENDLFITRNFFTSLILSLFKKNHILEIHDDILVEGRIIKFLIKRVGILNFKSIKKIITTTHSLKKRYSHEYKVNLKKIQVLHNASSISPSFKYAKKNKKRLKIGYFGSLFKSRGIDLIISLSNLNKENDYYIYGGSKTNINFLKQKYKNKNINFIQYVPYSKIDKEIKKIDICLLPYTSRITVSGDIGDISNYTSPLKIFDYMITGKLIICSNLKVIREVLKDNKNSILVKNYTDLKVWLKLIKSISRKYHKYNKIRLDAYKYAKKYDIRWRSKNILSF